MTWVQGGSASRRQRQSFAVLTATSASGWMNSCSGWCTVSTGHGAMRTTFSATLPNILVGSVGGGTGLPSQSAGLNILGLKGAGKAAALAEVAASLCLVGEISIIAALAAGHFVRAHASLARGR